MKKVLAVLLCVAMLCSCVCLFAFADDTAPAATYTYTFYDEDGTTLIQAVPADAGTTPVGPPAPEKPWHDGEAEYAFSGWVCNEDGQTYYSGTLPVATRDLTFVATFKKLHDNTDNGDITIMTFLASIFQRINKIMAQISTYFEELTKSVQNLLK